MRFANPIILLASLALAACGSVRKPDLRLPMAFEAAQPASSQPVALDRWWTAFDDPELTGLIDHAMVANPDARSAAARLREAQAQRADTLSQFLPKGDLTSSAKHTEIKNVGGRSIAIPGFATNTTYAANLNVSWEVDLFGRLFAAERLTRGQLDAARFDYLGARASLAAQVADAYFQVRGLAIQLADARETVRIQRELYDLASRRAQTGLAATSDPDRIAGDLAQAQAQADFLEAELQVERRTLLILAGRVAEPTAEVAAPPQVGRAPPVPVSVPSELLTRRPDVRQAEARLRAALGQRDLAKLALFPVFTFTPGLGWSKQEQPGFRTESASWTLGGTALQPVLSIPQRLAQARAQSAQADQAVAAYEKTVQTAFGEAEGALARLDADRRRVATLTEGEARSQRAYQAARLGYARGLIDLQTTLSAEQSWRATRAQLTTAEVQSVRQAVAAYKALGGGWSAADLVRHSE